MSDFNVNDLGSLIKKATSLSIPIASLKFSPITSISYSSARTKDWDDILTAHTDETFARTWTMQGKRLGKYSLGFVADSKAKGKERNTIGPAKVNLRLLSGIHASTLIFC
jgi:U3 small nucleolar RNA-associated protein 21